MTPFFNLLPKRKSSTDWGFFPSLWILITLIDLDPQEIVSFSSRISPGFLFCPDNTAFRILYLLFSKLNQQPGLGYRPLTFARII